VATNAIFFPSSLAIGISFPVAFCPCLAYPVPGYRIFESVRVFAHMRRGRDPPCAEARTSYRREFQQCDDSYC
jgi:hypothetical protein